MDFEQTAIKTLQMYIAVERNMDEIWIPCDTRYSKNSVRNTGQRNSMNGLQAKPAMPAQHKAQNIKDTQWCIQHYEMKTKHILGR